MDDGSFCGGMACKKEKEETKLTMMRNSLIFGLLLLFFGQGFAQEKIVLNGIWDFKIDRYNKGLADEWFLHPQAQQWGKLEVPGNWDTENEYANFSGVAWYHTSFETEAGMKDKLVRLYFESVYNEATVWLNGEKLGINPFGFLPFEYKITDKLRTDGPNDLVLRVDNTFKRGAIWNWGGIRRPVHLEVTEKSRLVAQKVTAEPNLKKGTAAIAMNLAFENNKSEDKTLTFEIEVTSKENPSKVIVKKKGNIAVGKGGTKVTDIHFNLAKKYVKLWDYNHPHLYRSKVSVFDGNEKIQEQTDQFGIRKLEVVGMELHLNGKNFRPLGFNMVPDDRFTGNTLRRERILEDIALMKSLGANFARVSHLPLPKEYLDLLDENGIMTFEEVALWGKDKWVDPNHPMPKAWLETMISTKYNHPSVIGWSVGNEIGYRSANPLVNEYVKSAIDHAKKLDPSRLAVYVSHSAQNQDNDASQYCDMVMLNIYGGWGNALKKCHKNFPNKPIFMSEYGGRLTEEFPNEGIVDGKKMLDQMRGKDYCVGASLWTLNDYRSMWHGSTGWATTESQNRAWGLVNTYRQKKRAYFHFREQYAPFDTLFVEHNQLVNTKQQSQIVLQPRPEKGLPAYELIDYNLVVKTFDKEGKELTFSTKKLPNIYPGGKELKVGFEWNKNADVAMMQVLVTDALGYDIFNINEYFTAPATPAVRTILNSTAKGRIVFEKVWNAEEYKLYYKGKDGEVKETEPTIDPYIQLGQLKKNKKFDCELVALNSFGESEKFAFVFEKNEEELPPLIFTMQGGNNCIFIGYDSHPSDFLYDVRYGTKEGEFEQEMSFNLRGSYKIPNLKPNTTYYVQMRKRMQWGFASQWSETYKITTKNNQETAQ
ncbi:glycoside hydrolase family 2 TIM barrel-domain containing protein [Flammeovirga aprica]|uniref:Beta-galactosidase n=1 Tax=Flammeovirga aprica JL-4 TaxID=694437 RepID=A0A7X9X9Z0_9BACT|nr:glycoside hydrolase family 2 TIM barrel-domain containing protein [Flammeovirga aprica]NME69148.1 hypothetical protein [Flammeovirga aprica JL-4]